MHIVASGPVAVHTFPVGLPGGHVHWFVVAKQTFEVGSGGCLPHQVQVPVLPAEAEHEGHRHTSDVGLHKEGCDVVVLGEAASLRPVERSEVRVRVGALDRTLLVTGDRVWERAPFGAMQASPPLRFERMPLTWSRAFGGAAVVDDEGHELVWPDNPEGRGFVRPGARAAAEGVALPNVEWPGRAMATWSDQPEPAGVAFYPRTWGLRLATGVRPGPKASAPPTILPAAFNQAHPAFVLPALPSGIARVDGAHPGHFEVSLPRPTARATLIRPTGPVELPITWDLLVLEPAAGRVVIAGRTAFPWDPQQDPDAHVVVRAGGAA